MCPQFYINTLNDVMALASAPDIRLVSRILAARWHLIVSNDLLGDRHERSGAFREGMTFNIGTLGKDSPEGDGFFPP